MDKPWKLVLLLIGIFAAGTITGGFVAVRFGRQLMPPHRGPEDWGANRIKKLTEKLDLSAEQQEKLRPIFKADGEELGKIRNASMTETRKLLDRMEKDVSAILTPEQQVKYEQMNREMHERMQRLMRERGAGGGPRPFRDHGPGEPPPETPGDHPPEKPPGG